MAKQIVLTTEEKANLAILEEKLGPLALLKLTDTALQKAYSDATKPVRDHFKSQGFHDYSKQEQEPGHKVHKKVTLYSGNKQIKSDASLYRPQTKDGDPRIRLGDLKKAALGGDTLALLASPEHLHAFNLTRLNDISLRAIAPSLLELNNMKPENRKALVVAYYLSKFDEAAYETFGYKGKTKTHTELANLIGVKESTLQNMRDEFDAIHDNPRKGWHQKPLIASRLKVISQYGNLNEEELRAIVKTLIQGTISNPLFSTEELNQIDNEERTAIEGETVERKVLSYKRNQAIVRARKVQDKYTCQACGFWHDDRIVECHHLKPISMSKEAEVKISELITLCPTCHKLAHHLLRKDYQPNTAKTVLLKNLKSILTAQ